MDKRVYNKIKKELLKGNFVYYSNKEYCVVITNLDQLNNIYYKWKENEMNDLIEKFKFEYWGHKKWNSLNKQKKLINREKIKWKLIKLKLTM